MKPLQLSEDVYPIGAFKSHASRILNEMRLNHRPVVITQNGRPAGVLITPEYFDKIREHQRFLAAVESGRADVRAGRTVSSAALDDLLDDEFGSLES